MALALTLLLLIAVAVLAFGVFQAARRQRSAPDRPLRNPATGRVFGRILWGGLGLAVSGAIGYVLAASSSDTYQGPMTGLPAAVLMMASLGAIVLGLLLALLSFVLKLFIGSNREDQQDDRTPD